MMVFWGWRKNQKGGCNSHGISPKYAEPIYLSRGETVSAPVDGITFEGIAPSMMPPSLYGRGLAQGHSGQRQCHWLLVEDLGRN